MKKGRVARSRSEPTLAEGQLAEMSELHRTLYLLQHPESCPLHEWGVIEEEETGGLFDEWIFVRRFESCTRCGSERQCQK